MSSSWPKLAQRSNDVQNLSYVRKYLTTPWCRYAVEHGKIAPPKRNDSCIGPKLNIQSLYEGCEPETRKSGSKSLTTGLITSVTFGKKVRFKPFVLTCYVRPGSPRPTRQRTKILFNVTYIHESEAHIAYHCTNMWWLKSDSWTVPFDPPHSTNCGDWDGPTGIVLLRLGELQVGATAST